MLLDDAMYLYAGCFKSQISIDIESCMGSAERVHGGRGGWINRGSVLTPANFMMQTRCKFAWIMACT